MRDFKRRCGDVFFRLSLLLGVPASIAGAFTMAGIGLVVAVIVTIAVSATYWPDRFPALRNRGMPANWNCQGAVCFRIDLPVNPPKDTDNQK